MVIIGLGFSIVCELSLYNLYQICYPPYPHTSVEIVPESSVLFQQPAWGTTRDDHFVAGWQIQFTSASSREA